MLRRWARDWWWWVLDYAFAAYWQVRGTLSRHDSDDFLSGSGRPVVILPGIWESWTFLRPLIDALHSAGHPVHVLAALGRNGRPVVATAEDVVRFLRDNDLRDVVFIAHSKGGLIGKYAMTLPDGAQRVAAMVAISSPFSGSRYAPYLVLRSLRAFSPRDPTTMKLAASLEINSRIVSIFGEFDPHIPEGSELPGARNLRLPTGGHFRVLARPETLRVVLEVADGAAPQHPATGR